jgi:hypothetical protein
MSVGINRDKNNSIRLCKNFLKIDSLNPLSALIGNKASIVKIMSMVVPNSIQIMIAAIVFRIFFESTSSIFRLISIVPVSFI